MPDVPPMPRVTDVQIVGDRSLRLTFDDGTVGDVSYEQRQFTGVLAPLNDPAVFAKVFVDKQWGTIAWPNGIDFAPEHLYEQALQNPFPTPSATA